MPTAFVLTLAGLCAQENTVEFQQQQLTNAVNNVGEQLQGMRNDQIRQRQQQRQANEEADYAEQQRQDRSLEAQLAQVECAIPKGYPCDLIFDPRIQRAMALDPSSLVQRIGFYRRVRQWKQDQAIAQAEAQRLADDQARRRAEWVKSQVDADARRKAEVKAAQQEEDTAPVIPNSRQISPGKTSDYYKKIAVERYPGVTDADSPLSVRMGEIDKYLGQIGSPLYQMQEKYLIITEMAAGELKIMPTR